MSPSRFALRPASAGALTAATAAALALALAGCHASSASGSASGSASAPGSASGTGSAHGTSSAAAAGTSSAAGSGSGGSGSVTSNDFPAQVGDSWTYTENFDGKPVTVRNQVTAVTHAAGGTEITETDTGNATGSAQTSTFTYVVRPDGSITVPQDVDTSAGSTVTSTGLFWPDPAQLASGQPVTETPVTTVTISGQRTTVTSHAVVRGEGTQTVTVPAGTYTATLVDDVLTEKIDGYTGTTDTKTWLVNGVGIVKQVVASGSGSSGPLSSRS